MVRKIFVTLVFALAALAAVAQEPAVFKFLGIPVDGKKADFISQLKQKGFTYDAKEDVLFGKFNGRESNIRVSENYGKVDRVFVADASTCSEAQIRIRFNDLLGQFRDIEKYFWFDECEPIPEGEDISYEMLVNNKVYVAAFYFNPIYGWTEEDITKMVLSLVSELSEKIGPDGFENLSEEKLAELGQEKLLQRIISMLEGQVWFRIVENRGEYYIALYYDNLKNGSNGADL